MELPGTMVFDYPTIDAMVAYIASKAAAAAPALAAASADQPEQDLHMSRCVKPWHLSTHFRCQMLPCK